MSKYCTQCGHELDQETGLCPNCNHHAVKYCVKCGSILDGQSGLCFNCEKDVIDQGTQTHQPNNHQIYKDTPIRKTKGKKIILFILAAIVLVIIGAGGFWVYNDKKNTAECTPETIIKVVDANGYPYPTFSIEIEGIDKTYTGDSKGITVSSLGLDEGTYTVVVTEINGEETHILKKISVSENKNNTPDSSIGEEQISDELLIATEEIITDEEKYQKILATLYSALNEKWSAEKIANCGVDIPPASVLNSYKMDDFGYCFKDLDQNGINELLIFNMNQTDKLFAVYTIENSEIQALIITENHTVINSCKNNLIEYSSDGAIHCDNAGEVGDNFSIWYKLSNNKLEFIEGRINMSNTDQYWLYTISDSKKYAQETSKDYFEKYEHEGLEGKPLNEYELHF